MRQETSLKDYPIPQSESLEIQVIADMVALPETIVTAEQLLTEEMFEMQETTDAWKTIKAMVKEGKTIDLPSLYGKIDRSMMEGVLRMLPHTGGMTTTIQHYASLKELYVRRKCYFAALDFLRKSCDNNVGAHDLIGAAGHFADHLRKEIDTEKGTQHISAVLNDLGEKIEEMQKSKASGKTLRIPTGFYSLDRFTYGGFNAGNLVILAARPSVGKTAIMLQMAKAAAYAGKAVNLFNLEMTNTELAQRFLFSTELVTPLQMARGEVEWNAFESASSFFASKPIYMNDSASSADEIISRITLNSQAGKCDIAFIDYLGLINMGGGSRTPLYQAIAETTKRLKQIAKACGIPIVLLCQLNRASASEKRPPALYDLRDSGSIEQDADIVLMLERANDDEEGKEVTMWVRKNRQGKAGDIKIDLLGNESFTSFADKADPTPPPLTIDDFNNEDNSEFPF